MGVSTIMALLKLSLNLRIHALGKLNFAFPKCCISKIVTGADFLKVVIFPRVIVLDWDPLCIVSSASSAQYLVGKRVRIRLRILKILLKIQVI